MLGLSFGKQARFVRPYANLREVMTDAVTRYAEDVRNGTYPSEAESYALPAEAAEQWISRSHRETQRPRSPNPTSTMEIINRRQRMSSVARKIRREQDQTVGWFRRWALCTRDI
jgi:hypothetical protein